MFTKQHHAVADGIGALRMAEVYTDLERSVDPPPEVDLAQIFAEAAQAEQGELLEAGADMGYSILDTATRTLGHNLRRQAGVISRLAGSLGGLITDPSRIPAGLTSVAGQVRSTLDTAAGTVAASAGAPLWKARSRRRHLEVLRVSLEDAKAAAKALEGSVNDFFVAGAAIGALAYHAERETPAEAINMTFVVSTRGDKAMGGNSFTPVPLQVPGEAMTTAEKFAQVRDLMAARRGNVSGGGAMSSIAGVANLLPTSVTTRFARQQAAKIDLATSNIRGAAFPTFIAGAQVLAGIPLGPVAGTAANLTTISQNGAMDMGLFVDPAAVTDPAGLRRNIDDAYQHLMQAGGIVA